MGYIGNSPRLFPNQKANFGNPKVVFLDQFCAKTNNPKFPFLNFKGLEAICLKSKQF